MNRLSHLSQTILFLVRKQQFYEIGLKIKRRLHSNTVSLGLRRDLTIPYQPPAAAIPISVRLLRDKDVPHLLNIHEPGLNRKELEEYTSRLLLLREGVGTCYVAVTEQDVPCFLQWLIRANDNEKLSTIFNGIFPTLREDEALLEDTFTPRGFRGQRIMPAATTMISEVARKAGARYVITFVSIDNMSSLKSHKRAGFVPYLRRVERWSFFQRTLSMDVLPANTPYPMDEDQSR